MSSRRNLEKRMKEDEMAAGLAFQDFIATFQDMTDIHMKEFVKSALLEGGLSDDVQRELYKPKCTSLPNKSTLQNAIECASLVKNFNQKNESKSKRCKSNLESFKEELKRLHTEREELAKYRAKLVLTDAVSAAPTTTNLFISNTSKKFRKADLIHVFGEFGALASVKIMWPRSDEPVTASNCGFVAYMARRDAERALAFFQSDLDIKVSWAKPVEIPQFPVYIPPRLFKFYGSSSESNLPFGAKSFGQLDDGNKIDDELLENSVIKVNMPLNKLILQRIHRMAEFVIREGPLFEAYIMNNEISNENYKFLFDNKSQDHVYYRWRLYALLHGDERYKWSLKPFRMFKTGSIWIPPILPNFKHGMPEELLSPAVYILDSQHQRLLHIIRNLTIGRNSIGAAMVFCIDHIICINDILDIVVDSLKNPNTEPLKKLARLFLLSDILYNVKLRNQSINFESIFAADLITIFESFYHTCQMLKYKQNMDQYELRVTKVLRYWHVCQTVSDNLITKLENSFMYNLYKKNTKNINPCDENEIITKKRKCLEQKISYFVPSKWDAFDLDNFNDRTILSEKEVCMEVNIKKLKK